MDARAFIDQLEYEIRKHIPNLFNLENEKITGTQREWHVIALSYFFECICSEQINNLQKQEALLKKQLEEIEKSIEQYDTLIRNGIDSFEKLI